MCVTQDLAAGGSSSGVSEIIAHPDYDASTIDNDIAVWHLSSSLSGSGIGSIDLPTSGSDPSSGTDVTVSGWYVLLRASSCVREQP